MWDREIEMKLEGSESQRTTKISLMQLQLLIYTFSAVRLKRLTEQAKTTALAGAGQQASW